VSSLLLLRSVSCRATIEYFRSICPITLRLDALFEAKAQVPYRRKRSFEKAGFWNFVYASPRNCSIPTLIELAMEGVPARPKIRQYAFA